MLPRAVLPPALLLVLLAVSSPALAKGKQCFTAGEMTAEREVRHGIFLRESARLCQANGYLTDSFSAWEKIEETNGARFRAAVARRAKAWKREFPKDWQVKQTHADAAIVTYARNASVGAAFCRQIDTELKAIGKSGYGRFASQTKPIRNEVADDYKTCR